jgi:hypothetical protein
LTHTCARPLGECPAHTLGPITVPESAVGLNAAGTVQGCAGLVDVCHAL